MKVSRVNKKKEPELSEEEKAQILHEAKATGLASLMTGGTIYGLGKLGENAKKLTNTKLKWINNASKKVAERCAENPKTVGTLKAGGLGLAATGAGLLGTAAYISHKNKKKKEKQDDSSKK